MMPSIEIDYETLDGIVKGALKDMLNMMIDGYRTAEHEVDKEGYKGDIAAIERVLRIYE
jgi:hypothetical protein